MDRQGATMTALGLAWALVRGMLGGRFRPGDVVVREFGPWDGAGRSTFKEVVFLDAAAHPEHPDPMQESGGIHHTMYGPAGTLPPRRLVRLD